MTLIWKHLSFSVIVTKGVNFCDIFITSLHRKAFYLIISTLQGKNLFQKLFHCFPGQEILSLNGSILQGKNLIGEEQIVS